MRKLKTPEEIMCRAKILSDDVTKWTNEEINLMIIATQRDTLECVAENVSLRFNPSAIEIDKSSILDLIPK